ncbi:MAG: kinase/pyrophosphorylase [Patescibacteria group bacterium]
MRGDGESREIVIISDNTGGTASRLVNAILVQYAGAGVEYSIGRVFSNIRTRKQVRDALGNIGDESFVIYTIITGELRNYLQGHLDQRNILSLDALGPVKERMSKFLGVHPRYRPGLKRKLDAGYFHEVDAIDFAKEHDDGCGSRLKEAELVLVGPSRSCKTPISMYLAINHGLWVANVPLIPDEMLIADALKRLKAVPRSKIVAMIIQPDALARWRSMRAIKMTGGGDHSVNVENYIDLAVIRREVAFFRRLYEKQGWKVVDASMYAVEEVADEVLHVLGHRT